MDLTKGYILALYTLVLLALTAQSSPLKERCYEAEENMAVFDHNEKVIRGTTFEECKQYCDEETSFYCLSLDYTASGTCYLNNANHLTDPEAYGTHRGAIYAYVTDCGQSKDGESSSESDILMKNEINEDIKEEGFTPNGRCYRFIHNKHLYGYDQYMVEASDLQDCLSKCDMEQEFTCLAVNYLPSGDCELMPLTQEEEPDLFDVYDGSVYAEVTQCDSDATKRFISRENSEETDDSSGSLSDENGLELYDWM